MDKLVVTANKLNKRSSVPASLSDKTNIVGVALKGTVFQAEEVGSIPNPALGKWYKDRDNYYYWGGGISVVGIDIPVIPDTAQPGASKRDIPADTIRKVFPGASDEKISDIVEAFNLGYEAFSLDTNVRRAHFFAQMLQEVGSSASTKEENMNYSVEALMNFSYFKKHPDEAQKYGRSAAHAANQEAIANRAYADRLGNGDVASGDGWRYRGKGFIQLTGRSNYLSIQRHMDDKLPGSGINIITSANDILSTKGAMLSAMAFFSKNYIHFIADAGSSDEVVNRVTAVVNKHTDSYSERAAHFRRLKPVFGLG